VPGGGILFSPSTSKSSRLWRNPQTTRARRAIFFRWPRQDEPTDFRYVHQTAGEGRAGAIRSIPTNPSLSGELVHPVPKTLALPHSINGYRRTLLKGRTVSIYFDRERPNEWLEHSHHQAQILILLEAHPFTLRWRQPDGIWRDETMHGPNVSVLSGGVAHTAKLEHESDLVVLYVERSTVDEIVPVGIPPETKVSLVRIAKRDMAILRLAKLFQSLCRGQEKRSDEFIKSLGRVLAEQILRALFTTPVKPVRLGKLSEEVMRRLNQFIEDHMQEKIPLAALASIAGLSLSQFGKMLVRTTGHPPRDFLMRRRVERAVRLLLTTDKKQTDICGECGFTEDSTMFRWFRIVHDCRPGEIRAQRAAKNNSVHEK
jgi:AraC family transcriptional regulator